MAHGSKVAVTVLKDGHRHAGKPVAKGAQVHMSPAAAGFMTAAGVGRVGRAPAAESEPDSLAHAQDSKPDGDGESGSDSGDAAEDDDGEPPAGAATAAPALQPWEFAD